MLYVLLERLRGWLVDRDLYWLFRVLDQVEFRAFAAAGLAFLIVMVLGRPTIHTLVRMKIGDSGQTDAKTLDKVAKSKQNTPTMGGVLIAGAILCSTLLLADITSFYIILGMIVLVWLAVLGGADDWLKLTASRRGTGRQGLYAWEKLVFQLGIGLLAGWFVFSHGNTEADRDLAHVLNLPFQKTYSTDGPGDERGMMLGEPGESDNVDPDRPEDRTGLEPQESTTLADAAAQEGAQALRAGGFDVNPSLIYLTPLIFVVITVLMVAGLSNAVNITDGMDGLAPGISAAVAIGLFVLTLISGSEAASQYLLVPHIPESDELAVLAGAMAGACLGFLWWNCAPAQMFMGDTGALCLGGLIAYIAVVTRQEFVVLLMCGVFLFEILTVVMQVGYFRMTGGRRIFRCAPYHHHLHDLGWQEQKIVARFWIISIVLVVIALASIKLR